MSEERGRRFEADGHVWRVTVQPNSDGGAFGFIDVSKLPPVERIAWVRFEREGNPAIHSRTEKPLDGRYENDLTDAEVQAFYDRVRSGLL